MTLKLHLTRIHPWLAPVGVVLAALSPALWFAASRVESSNHRMVFYAAAVASSLALLLLYLVVLFLDLDSRRALGRVRRAVDRGRQGHYLAPPSLMEQVELGRRTGAHSRWADTLGLLAELLQDHGNTLLNLLDGLSPGVVLFNRRSEVLTANLSFCHLFHLDRDGIRGKTLQDLVSPDVARRWSPQAVAASNWFGDGVTEVMDSSSGRHFRTSVVQVRPGKEDDGLLALFIEDLTARGVANADADEFQQLYQKILESISEAILLVGPDGCVDDINGTAADLLGYERAQARGMKLAQFLVPGSEDEAVRRLDSYVLSGDWKLHGRRLDVLFCRADGSAFLGEVRLGEWEHAGRRLVLISLRDTTKEQQADLLTKERLQVVEMLSRHQPLDKVLTKLAEMIDHQLPEAACAVMLRRGDRLFAVASPNLPPGFAAHLCDLPMDDSGTSCAAAASGGKMSTVADIAESGMREDLRQAALEHGLRASWSAPIISSEGPVVGTVAVYHRQPGEPTNDQGALLEMAGRLASICIEQRELTGQLMRQAQHDPLTGLPNRATFEDHLKRAIAGARRSGRSLGVLTVDLDRFKQVNDTLGHAAGDKLLCEVARRMQASVRGTDIVARWGGDEFLIGLAELRDRQDAMRIASKVMESVRAPFEIDGHTLVTTATVGISLFPDDGQDLSSLMRNADHAMYSAKTSGRNGVQCYTPQLTEAARQRLDLENHLRRALERSEFVLHYQPKFDLKTGSLSGLEALLRWQHPDRGLVQPADFIPIAEENGLIVPIGEWVLREATREARHLTDNCHAPVRVSVNVSSIQFARPDFVEVVARAAQEAGIHPNLLELELTEGLLMQDFSQACSRMTKLRELGVQVTIDDFGAGYTSLSYLQQLQADSLKIDRSFIQELGGSKKGPLLVQSIVGLARSLHMKAAAGGVESIAQLSALQSAGCDSVQGFLFAKALPLDDVQRLVLRFPRIAVPRFLAVMPQAKNPAWRATARTRPLTSDLLLSTGPLESSLTVVQ
jgi:diguanylate cyclase (GGDEF)-like protein/PAS domain S-box-containing protein